jgi:hypothetical protein
MTRAALFVTAPILEEARYCVIDVTGIRSLDSYVSAEFMRAGKYKCVLIIGGKYVSCRGTPSLHMS